MLDPPPRLPRTRPDGIPRRPRADTIANNIKRPRVRFAPPLDAAQLATLASKSGFLRKQADNEPGKWTKYYFVLKSSTFLYYYNTDTDKEPRGIIDLEFLTDVRYNAECLQRSVGGSEHTFRVTGQMPPEFSDKDDSRTKLRPLYLDTDTNEEAMAWMDAIASFRFDPEREGEFIDLLNSMEDLDAKMTKMISQTKDIEALSQAILHKGKEYVCKLRGVETNDVVGRPRAMTSAQEDIGAALANIDALFDEMYAEANQHARQVTLLRKFETEYKEKEAEFKKREADFKAQDARCQQLEQEIVAYKRKMEKLKHHVTDFDARDEELSKREREMAMREKELNKRLKGVERECERKLKEVEKEAERRALDFERRQKEMDKMQRDVEQRQMKLDKKLKDAPTGAMKFAAAMGMRESVASLHEHHQSTPDEENEANNLQLALRPAPAKTKSKSLFKKPGFLKKKRPGSRPSTMFLDEHDIDDMYHKTEVEETPVPEDEINDDQPVGEQWIAEPQIAKTAFVAPPMTSEETGKPLTKTISKKEKETRSEYRHSLKESVASAIGHGSDTEGSSNPDDSSGNLSRGSSFNRVLTFDADGNEEESLGTPREEDFIQGNEAMGTPRSDRDSDIFGDVDSLVTPKQECSELEFEVDTDPWSSTKSESANGVLDEASKPEDDHDDDEDDLLLMAIHQFEKDAGTPATSKTTTIQNASDVAGFPKQVESTRVDGGASHDDRDSVGTSKVNTALDSSEGVIIHEDAGSDDGSGGLGTPKATTAADSTADLAFHFDEDPEDDSEGDSEDESVNLSPPKAPTVPATDGELDIHDDEDSDDESDGPGTPEAATTPHLLDGFEFHDDEDSDGDIDGIATPKATTASNPNEGFDSLHDSDSDDDCHDLTTPQAIPTHNSTVQLDFFDDSDSEEDHGDLGTPKATTTVQKTNVELVLHIEEDSDDDIDDLGTPKATTKQASTAESIFHDERESDAKSEDLGTPKATSGFDAPETPKEEGSHSLFDEPDAASPPRSNDSRSELNELFGTPTAVTCDRFFFNHEDEATTPKRETINSDDEIHDSLGTPRRDSDFGKAPVTTVATTQWDDHSPHNDHDSDDARTPKPTSPISGDITPRQDRALWSPSPRASSLIRGKTDAITPRQESQVRSPSPRASWKSSPSRTPPPVRVRDSHISDDYQRGSQMSGFTSRYGDDDDDEDDSEADDAVAESLVKKKKKMKFFKGKFPKLPMKAKKSTDLDDPASTTSRKNTITSITSDYQLDEEDATGGTPKKKGKWKGKLMKKLPKKPFGKSKRTATVASPPPVSPGFEDPPESEDEVDDGRCEF